MDWKNFLKWLCFMIAIFTFATCIALGRDAMILLVVVMFIPYTYLTFRK